MDTTLGETAPDGMEPVQPASRADLTHVRSRDGRETKGRVVHHAALAGDPASPRAAPGVREAPVMGPGISRRSTLMPPIGQLHGFRVNHLSLDAGASSPRYSNDKVEVLMVHCGDVQDRRAIAARAAGLQPGAPRI